MYSEARLQHRLPARPDSVAQLRRAVTSYALHNGASQRQREDIALAVSEAISNAVLHAYVGRDRPGDVNVSAWMQDRCLEVVVSDDGSGLAPRPDSPGLGLGLVLMGQMADQLRFEKPESVPGMRVQMSFSIG